MIAASISVAACGSKAGAGTPVVTVDTVADTTVVSNDIPPEAERVFGSRDVKARIVWPGDSFFAPRPMAIDSAGRIFVGDRTRVVMIAANHRRSSVLDRAGDGPGEFRIVESVAALGDTGVLVWDARHARLTWERDDGHVLRTTRVTPPGRQIGAKSFPLIADDSTVTLAWDRGVVWTGPPADTTVIDRHDFATDSAHIVAGTPNFVFARLGPVSGPKDAFHRMSLLAGSPAGIVALVDGLDYAFHLVTLGPTRRDREVRRRWMRRPTSELRDAPDSLLATVGRMRSIDSTVVADEHLGNRKNAIDELWLDPEGRTWVRPVDSTYRYHPQLLGQIPALRPPTCQWEVFDSTGRLLGRTYLPSRFHPQVMRACEVYGLYENDDGTKSVAGVDIPAVLCADRKSSPRRQSAAE